MSGTIGYTSAQGTAPGYKGSQPPRLGIGFIADRERFAHLVLDLRTSKGFGRLLYSFVDGILVPKFEPIDRWTPDVYGYNPERDRGPSLIKGPLPPNLPFIARDEVFEVHFDGRVWPSGWEHDTFTISLRLIRFRIGDTTVSPHPKTHPSISDEVSNMGIADSIMAVRAGALAAKAKLFFSTAQNKSRTRFDPTRSMSTFSSAPFTAESGPKLTSRVYTPFSVDDKQGDKTLCC